MCIITTSKVGQNKPRYHTGWWQSLGSNLTIWFYYIKFQVYLNLFIINQAILKLTLKHRLIKKSKTVDSMWKVPLEPLQVHHKPAIGAIAERGLTREDITLNMKDSSMNVCVRVSVLCVCMCVDRLRPAGIISFSSLVLCVFLCLSLNKLISTKERPHPIFLSSVTVKTTFFYT